MLYVTVVLLLGGILNLAIAVTGASNAPPVSLALGLLMLAGAGLLERRRRAPKATVNETYHGLSLRSDGTVQYAGPITKVDLAPADMGEVVLGIIERERQVQVLVLPQMGVVIGVHARGQFAALRFRSPMTNDQAASLMRAMISHGKKVRINEKYGAFEIAS